MQTSSLSMPTPTLERAEIYYGFPKSRTSTRILGDSDCGVLPVMDQGVFPLTSVRAEDANFEKS
jgi:hypothetical protein